MSLFSTHIFLFAFRWYKLPDHEEEIYHQIPDKKDLREIEEELNKIGWIDSNYTHFGYAKDFNEYQYFYSFVRDVLYDKGEKNENLIRHFTINKSDDDNIGEYRISIRGGDTYTLTVKDILLNIYNTGVGVLSFHLKNEKHQSKEDVLKINEYGRRLYPQFLGGGFNVLDTKNSFLPDSIELMMHTHSRFNVYEDFSAYHQLHALESVPISKAEILPAHINCFLPVKEYDIKPLLDDRMFVVSWFAGEGKLSSDLAKKKYASSDKIEYGYQTSDWWYCYVFVDGKEPTIRDSNMSKRLLTDNTYARWVSYLHNGYPSPTLFGASRYSFVAYSSNEWLIMPHMTGLYYKMIELCLVQRASILYYSGLVSEISRLLMRPDYENKQDLKERAQLIREIKNLYLSYINFINKICFREVTPQEQGIEIYDMMQKIMRIPEHIKDLDHEIAELHQFMTLEEQDEENKNSMRLTKIATIFLPLTVVIGFLGMNTIPSLDEKAKESLIEYFTSPDTLISLALNLLIILIAFVLILRYIGWKYNFKFDIFNFYKKSKDFHHGNDA